MKIKLRSKLHDFSEEHIRHLIKKYEGKDFGSKKKLTFAAADLLSEIREIATYQYRTPFLEQFYTTLNRQGKALNHIYILKKYVLPNEQELHHRDRLGIIDIDRDYEEDEIIMLNKKKNLYIVKGVLLQAIKNMGATKAVDYIKDIVTTKYSSSPAAHEDIVYIFDVVREALEDEEFTLESLIKEDLESNGDTRLIYEV